MRLPGNQFSNVILKLKAAGKITDTNSTLDGLFAAKPYLFGYPAYQRSRFIAELYDFVGMSTVPKPFYAGLSLPPPEKTFEPRPLDFSQFPQARAYYNYCSSCHAQEGDYMDVENETQLWDAILARKELIKKRLGWESGTSPMPPKTAPEHKQLRDVFPQDRQAMLQSLQ